MPRDTQARRVIIPVGGSGAITLPRHWLRTHGLQLGDRVEVTEREHEIVVRPLHSYGPPPETKDWPSTSPDAERVGHLMTKLQRAVERGDWAEVRATAESLHILAYLLGEPPCLSHESRETQWTRASQNCRETH